MLAVCFQHAADPQGTFANGGGEGWKVGGGKRAILAYPERKHKRAKGEERGKA